MWAGLPGFGRSHVRRGRGLAAVKASSPAAGRSRAMATADPGLRGPRPSVPGARPGGVPARAAGAMGPPLGRSGSGPLRSGERTPAAVEKRGPYMVARAPSLQAKLQKHRDLAKAVLRRKGVLGAPTGRPDSAGRRPVKFNKGYTALSQCPDENLVSLDSDSDGELGSRCSSGYSSSEQVNQDVSRQLLQDGYHLDEIPDDEDLDLIPPKPVATSACSCCWCCPGDSACTLQ